MSEETILKIDDLSVRFETEDGVVNAVNDLSLEIKREHTLGLVGETGAGKTTTALSILNLIPVPPGKIASGKIILNGKDVLSLNERELEDLRGNECAMIFQDPMTALDPVITVGDQIAESILVHEHVKEDEAFKKAEDLLEMVGIAKSRAHDYPHQLSGGMKQRVVIAIALACHPQLLIADEPTTALDVTIQAQVLALIKELIDKNHMSMLMITHDLGIVAETCDDVAVMYAGRIIESGTADDIFNHTMHPYTEGLFNSLPNLRKKGEELQPIKGLMPDPMHLPSGCAFSPRCPYATEACTKEIPALSCVSGEHYLACIAYRDSSFKLGSVKNGQK